MRQSNEGDQSGEQQESSSGEPTEVFEVADLTAAFAFQYEGVTLRQGANNDESAAQLPQSDSQMQEKQEAPELTPAFAFSGKLAKLAENL